LETIDFVERATSAAAPDVAAEQVEVEI